MDDKNVKNSEDEKDEEGSKTHENCPICNNIISNTHCNYCVDCGILVCGKCLFPPNNGFFCSICASIYD